MFRINAGSGFALMALALGTGCEITVEDDDTFLDDDTFAGDYEFEIYGNALIGAYYDTWKGSEVYGERIFGEQVCDVGFSTYGSAAAVACDGCDFTFDVTYAQDYDDSTVDCEYTYAPYDDEVLTLGYYVDMTYGPVVVYDTGAYFEYFASAGFDGEMLEYAWTYSY